MALFHFQLRSDSHLLMAEGAELPSLNAARVEAAIRLGGVLEKDAARLWIDEDWQMDVTDDKGLVLFSILVAAVESAAARGAAIG